VKPGKGAAFVRTKLKNQVSGACSGARVARPRIKCALSQTYRLRQHGGEDLPRWREGACPGAACALAPV
jgi:hypothetical protein